MYILIQVTRAIKVWWVKNWREYRNFWNMWRACSNGKHKYMFEYISLTIFIKLPKIEFLPLPVCCPDHSVKPGSMLTNVITLNSIFDRYPRQLTLPTFAPCVFDSYGCTSVCVLRLLIKRTNIHHLNKYWNFNFDFSNIPFSDAFWKF